MQMILHKCDFAEFWRHLPATSFGHVAPPLRTKGKCLRTDRATPQTLAQLSCTLPIFENLHFYIFDFVYVSSTRNSFQKCPFGPSAAFAYIERNILVKPNNFTCQRASNEIGSLLSKGCFICFIQTHPCLKSPTGAQNHLFVGAIISLSSAVVNHAKREVRAASGLSMQYQLPRRTTLEHMDTSSLE